MRRSPEDARHARNRTRQRRQRHRHAVRNAGRSEVAALEWRDIEVAGEVPGAFRIRVRSSKTNQGGAETDVRLIKNGATAALAAIRPADAEPCVEVFGGLNGQSIGRRFSAATAAAGVDGLTAHSGRVGHASELTVARREHDGSPCGRAAGRQPA